MKTPTEALNVAQVMALIDGARTRGVSSMRLRQGGLDVAFTLEPRPTEVEAAPKTLAETQAEAKAGKMSSVESEIDNLLFGKEL